MNRRDHYLEALGVDAWKPRRAASTTAATPAPAPADPSARTHAPVPAADPVPAARAEADSLADMNVDEAESWRVLAAQVATCTQCELSQTRTRTVFGVGERRAELLVIGEAPGADEDRQGEPFVGRAGQLLNSMLRAMGHPRETVFIANVLKCRPPGNRDPKPGEVACCLPYLRRQIELLRPRLMLAVGRIAAQNLLATDTPIGKLRGSVHRFALTDTPLIVTYHPAYLLRSPLEKRRAWTDLKFARAELLRLQAAGSAANAEVRACR